MLVATALAVVPAFNGDAGAQNVGDQYAIQGDPEKSSGPNLDRTPRVVVPMQRITVFHGMQGQEYERPLPQDLRGARPGWPFGRLLDGPPYPVRPLK
jgi:hypothetical protein